MNIAILWTGLSGYINTCMKELAQREGVVLFVCHQAPSADAPFDEDQFGWISNRMAWRTAPDRALLDERLATFSPDVLIIPSWHIAAYRRVARRWAKKTIRLMTMDNPWRGTWKQWLGVLSAPYYVHSLADAVWLPGERQAVFARKMGFRQRSTLRGLYSCDQERMGKVHLARVAARQRVPRKFIFVGQLVARKGVETLANAYRLYRKAQAKPWPLICCGTGPLGALLEGQNGIELRGFVQPDKIPVQLADAGCLILPSSFEPWALVVHEAASAGLLIIASENVGATVHLVQQNYNGFISDNGDVGGLAELMGRVSDMTDAQLDAMSGASYSLSQQFSPGRWADTILDFFHSRAKSVTASELAP